MTPLEKRNKIAAALTGQIGTYTLEDGTIIPSLWVSPPMPSNNWVRSGLEVVLQLDSSQNVTPISWAPTDGLYIEAFSSIVLVQYDLTKTLRDAVNALMLAFPISKVVSTPQTDDAYERATVTITDKIFYH
jgi:hypothetical protein